MTSLLQRPRVMLRICATLVLLLSLAVMMQALRNPTTSFAAIDMGEGNIRLQADAGRIDVATNAPVRFRSSNGRSVALLATQLPELFEPRSDAAANHRFWQARDAIAAMVAAGPVRVDAGGTRHLIMVARSRTVASLQPAFWVPLATGAIGLLITLWVWALRPGEWASRLFALGGFGLFGGCATMALVAGTGLALPGSTDRLMMVLNYISTLLYGASLAALFARFPAVIVRHGWLFAMLVANATAAVIVAVDAMPGSIDVVLVAALGDCVMMVVLLGWQVHASWNDVAKRAALIPIAIGTGISVLSYGIGCIATSMFGGTALLAPDLATPVLLFLYLGLALAITRARLFALGRWALGILLSACAIILFLVLDAIVLTSAGQKRDLAFVVTIVLGITIYQPLREWVLQRSERRGGAKNRELLQMAGQLALAPDAESATRAWHGAARAMYDPLEIEPISRSGDRPTLSPAANELYLPSPAGDAAFLLRFPDGGTRAFGALDIETAGHFSGLVRQLIDARDAYVRGVSEERSRIARDLHDDVSSRLLISLHRKDQDAIHHDVRSAMADIRSIVSGLSGESQSLDGLLANLRHETQNRLDAAGIALDWPLAETTLPISLDYAKYRHLLSIVRECVSNIIRHSGANRASIAILHDAAGLTVLIADNGCGLDRAVSGHGQQNAAERAAILGGTFSLEPTSTGTRARIQIPLTATRGHADALKDA